MKITIMAHDDNAQEMVLKCVDPDNTLRKKRVLLEPGQTLTFGITDRSERAISETLTDQSTHDENAPPGDAVIIRAVTALEVFGIILDDEDDRKKHGKKKAKEKDNRKEGSDSDTDLSLTSM